jgi:hypothetical protein
LGAVEQLALKVLPAELVAERCVGAMSIMLVGWLSLLRWSGWKKPGVISTAVGGTVPLLAVLLTVGLDPPGVLGRCVGYRSWL